METLDDETLKRSICDALDIDYEEVKDRLPKSAEELIHNEEINL